MSAAARLDRWIAGFHPLSPEGLGIYRIAFALWQLLSGVPSVAFIAAFPDSLFEPQRSSLVAHMDGFPPAWVLHLLDTSYACALAALLVGYRTRTASWALTLLYLAMNHFRFSFGKVDHDMVLVLLPAIMSFSGWGSRYSVDSRRAASGNVPEEVVRARGGWVPAMVALLLSFGFLTAGVPKLIGWVDFDLTTSGTLAWVLRGYVLNRRRDLLLPHLLQLDAPVVWELLDYSAVAFELSFALLLWNRRLWRGVLVAACLFHFGNCLIVNISFAPLLGVYALYVDWDSLARAAQSGARTERALDWLTTSRGALTAAAVVVGSNVLLRLVAQNSDTLTPFALFGWNEGLGQLLVGAAQFLGLGALLFRSLRPARTAL